MHTYGGSFMYHILDNDQPLVLVGYVVCSDDNVSVEIDEDFRLGCIGLSKSVFKSLSRISTL